MAAVLPRPAAGGTPAVIGFLYFSTWFGHVTLLPIQFDLYVRYRRNRREARRYICSTFLSPVYQAAQDAGSASQTEALLLSFPNWACHSPVEAAEPAYFFLAVRSQAVSQVIETGCN